MQQNVRLYSLLCWLKIRFDVVADAAVDGDSFLRDDKNEKEKKEKNAEIKCRQEEKIEINRIVGAKY